MNITNSMLREKSAFILLIMVLGSLSILRGQNLVVNPSFEIPKDSNTLIPPGEFHINKALGWNVASRAQATLYSSIPAIATTNRAMNKWRFMAKEGNNVVGIITYGTVMGDDARELREYMHGSLVKPLTVGKKYYISYWVHFLCEGTNNIGVAFVTKPFFTDSVYRLKLKPLVNNSQIVNYTNGAQWTFVRDSFTAREPFKHFIIGNFFSNAKTQLQSNRYHHHKAFFDEIAIEEALDTKMPARSFEMDENVVVSNEKTKSSEPNSSKVTSTEDSKLNPTTDKRENAETIEKVGNIEKNKVEKNNKTQESTANATAPEVIKGDVLILNKVLFNFNSSDLDPVSFAQIDMLTLLLQRDKTMKILVKGHTSSEGSDEYNLKLSENRAKSVVNYLVSKGIERSRLSFKGYGKTQPIEGNDTEESRQKNRRVEFEVME